LGQGLSLLDREGGDKMGEIQKQEKVKSRISRRNFLKGTAVVGLGVAGVILMGNGIGLTNIVSSPKPDLAIGGVSVDDNIP